MKTLDEFKRLLDIYTKDIQVSDGALNTVEDVVDAYRQAECERDEARSKLMNAAPLVSSDENDATTFEWWNGTRKLTIYHQPHKTVYVKVWGSNIFTEMENGVIGSQYEMSALWRWLWENQADV